MFSKILFKHFVKKELPALFLKSQLHIMDPKIIIIATHGKSGK